MSNRPSDETINSPATIKETQLISPPQSDDVTPPVFSRIELLARIESLVDKSKFLPLLFTEPSPNTVPSQIVSQYHLALINYQDMLKDLNTLFIATVNHPSGIDNICANIEFEIRKTISKINKFLTFVDKSSSSNLSGLSAEIEALGWEIKQYIKSLAYFAIHSLELSKVSSSIERPFQLGLHLLKKPTLEHKAAPHFAKAAEAGHIKATYYLGWCYEQGIGTYKSIPNALANYRKAAVLNDPDALFRLGVFYTEAIGVKVDFEKGFKYFRKSAFAGNADGQYILGYYHQNRGDDVKAKKWYHKAADQNHAQAQFNLGLYHMEQFNYTKAAEFYTKSADQGYAKAQNNLAQLYENGLIGSLPDEDKAGWLYWSAARQGDKDAQFNLGNLYLGHGNLEEAIKWLIAAMLQNDTQAENQLMTVLAQNPELQSLAVKVLMLACAEESELASSKLDLLYMNFPHANLQKTAQEQKHCLLAKQPDPDVALDIKRKQPVDYAAISSLASLNLHNEIRHKHEREKNTRSLDIGDLHAPKNVLTT